jgi:hypothetical protein
MPKPYANREIELLIAQAEKNRIEAQRAHENCADLEAVIDSAEKATHGITKKATSRQADRKKESRR